MEKGGLLGPPCPQSIAKAPDTTYRRRPVHWPGAERVVAGHFNIASLVAHPFNSSTGGRGKLGWSTQ